MRQGYVEIAPGVGVPREAVEADPTIRWNHVDGPMMTWAGHMRWLTWRERFFLWIGRETPEGLARKHWPAFQVRVAREHTALFR